MRIAVQKNVYFYWFLFSFSFNFFNKFEIKFHTWRKFRKRDRVDWSVIFEHNANTKMKTILKIMDNIRNRKLDFIFLLRVFQNIWILEKVDNFIRYYSSNYQPTAWKNFLQSFRPNRYNTDDFFSRTKFCCFVFGGHLPRVD